MRRWLKIGSGVAASVTTVVGLFFLLTINFGFQITDLTGDIICEGTYENPCISEFEVKNPTKYDVDIYSKDQVKLDFSPNIKDYALFVPDGRCSATGKCACELKDGSKLGFEDWRCVDFTNKTKPRQDKVYNFRFKKYSTTTFKLAGIKNEKNDIIKWGFGVNEEYLDPIWTSISDKEYVKNLREKDSLRIKKGDYYKSYNVLDKRLLIENSEYDLVLDLILESNYTEAVISGNDKLISWFLIKDYLGDDLVDDVKFYDVNNNYSVIDKNYTFKYKTRENISICDELENCEMMEDDVWTKFNLLSELPYKNIEIGLFIDINEGDKIEWVISKDGFEIYEWALVIGTNAGLVTTAPTADPATGSGNTIDDQTKGVKITTTDAVTITEMGWYATGSSQESNFEVGIYSHDSGNDIPLNLIYFDRTNAKGTTEGWKTKGGLSWDLNATTVYWLGVQLDNTATSTAVALQSGRTGERYSFKVSQSTLVSPFSPSNSVDDNLLGIYALHEAAVTQCSNTVDTDWLITDAQVCDNQELNIGTGEIIISTGNLTLINSGNVTTSGLNITQDGEKVFIFDNSNLIVI